MYYKTQVIYDLKEKAQFKATSVYLYVNWYSQTNNSYWDNKENLCEVLPEKHNDGLLITRSSSSIGNSQNEKETEPDVICIRNATPTKTTR